MRSTAKATKYQRSPLALTKVIGKALVIVTLLLATIIVIYVAL